ncbi:MAG: pyruvate kinase [Planctomycetota bacterium]|nr:pyruvate kinase [Planctomycetota bacterium]
MKHARTRIVATVGPACEDPIVLRDLIAAGADVLRLNGAHMDERAIAPWVRRVRKAATAAGRNVAVMVDLPGVKLRVAPFADGAGLALVAGTRIALAAGASGSDAACLRVHPWPDVRSVRQGAAVLLDDGRLRLRIVSRRGARLSAEVVEGGLLLGGKGVAFPGVPLGLEVPTRRDLTLARAAAQAGADWLALSFVRSGKELVRLRSALKRAGRRVLPIAAKIERREAIAELDGILAESEAAIVARGDLGVDVGGENVPALQKLIVESAHRAGCPVIVATEMLDSMTTRVRPTRAEVSDVSGAVFEGADGVLLSAETAVGAYPVLAVRTLERILGTAESDVLARVAGGLAAVVPAGGANDPDRCVVRAAVALAQAAGVRAIVVFTRGGASAVRVSKARPEATIHAFATSDVVVRQLALAWGVEAERLPARAGTDRVVAEVTRRLRARGALAGGDRAVLLMGGAADPAGATTLIKLLTC